MTSPADAPLLLGIDGGGTKTTAWLASLNGENQPQVVGRMTTSGSNPRALGFERAFEVLDVVVAGAFRDAGIDQRPVDAACIALAGVGRDSERAELTRWSEQRQLTRKLHVATDAEPVLAAGTPENWGVALIAGTGSFCFGKTIDGRTARAGGWGYLFGDEGSGYALALAGLRAVAHAADGRGPETVLESRFIERLNLQNPSDLVNAVYAGPLPRTDLASLADVVVGAADAGDAVAVKLLRGAAADLARHVRAVAQRIELEQTQVPLALAGGLLTHAGWLRDGLIEDLEQSGLIPAPVNVVREPIVGAINLANRLLRSGD